MSAPRLSAPGRHRKPESKRDENASRHAIQRFHQGRAAHGFAQENRGGDQDGEPGQGQPDVDAGEGEAIAGHAGGRRYELGEEGD